MREHAGHQVAVDGVEDQDDVEHEQGDVALARVFHDERSHGRAHQQIGPVPIADPLGAEGVVLGVHVVGDRERKRDVDRGDDEVGRKRQARVEIVLAQAVKDEQRKGDRNQRHRQQRGAAFAGPEVLEEIEEEANRNDVVDVFDDEPRPRLGGLCHACSSLPIAEAGGARGAPSMAKGSVRLS